MASKGLTGGVYSLQFNSSVSCGPGEGGSGGASRQTCESVCSLNSTDVNKPQDPWNGP